MAKKTPLSSSRGQSLCERSGCSVTFRRICWLIVPVHFVQSSTLVEIDPPEVTSQTGSLDFAVRNTTTGGIARLSKTYSRYIGRHPCFQRHRKIEHAVHDVPRIFLLIGPLCPA